MNDEHSGYSHDDMQNDANLGAEPSKHYLETVDRFDNVVRNCMYVSRGFGGIPSPSGRHYWASVLFTALITRGVSLAHLMPFGPWTQKHIERWDYASMAVITRTMLELRLAFHYLCVDACGDEEWQCRWNIMNLHDCCSRLRLFEAMETDSEKDIKGFQAQAEELRDRLRGNTHFQALPRGTQNKLLNGQTAYLFPLEEIAERAGIKRETFRYMYVLLSSHVHGLPMSFYRMNEERGRGLPSPTEEGYTTLCLSLAVSLLVATRDAVEELFKEFKARGQSIVQRELQPAQAQADAPAGQGLKEGESMIHTETDDVVVEVSMEAGPVLRSTYKTKPVGHVVLRCTDSDEGAVLEEVDPYFWTVLVNNKPMTLADRHVVDQPFAFKIDHATRSLHLKTEADSRHEAPSRRNLPRDEGTAPIGAKKEPHSTSPVTDRIIVFWRRLIG